jgi:hypothetical protein
MSWTSGWSPVPGVNVRPGSKGGMDHAQASLLDKPGSQSHLQRHREEAGEMDGFLLKIYAIGEK